MVKYVFWCIFKYFQTTRNIGSKMMLFNVWSGNTRVLMHLRILQDHQNQVLKKIFFNVWSGYWCVCAYFQTTRNMGSKMMLFNVCCGNIRVLMHLRILPNHQNQVLKTIFFYVGVVINVFLRICIFYVWSDKRRVFMHLRILPNHQNQVLKIDIF
jgi:ribosome biogenesis SPOUT family RNA methylase Rps3